jgi:hypothetical protein
MIVTNSKEALKKRAEARFKKDELEKARRQCWNMRRRVAPFAKKTARLRALRLDKEAAEKNNEGVDWIITSINPILNSARYAHRWV